MRALAASVCAFVVGAAALHRGSTRAAEPAGPQSGAMGRGERVALETLGGLGGAALGGLIGFGIAYAAIGDEGDFGGLAAAFYGGVPGAAIGLPTGIYVVGELAGGDGNYWATWGGVLAGAVVPTLLTATLAGDDDSTIALVALWAVLPTAGGVIGYELSQSERDTRPTGARLFVLPTDGGVFAGLVKSL